MTKWVQGRSGEGPEKHPQFSRPWKAGDAPFDPADIRQRILDERTALGRFIKPLAQKLVELPPDRQTESLETFGLIHGFLKEKDLSGLEFTREDILFLLADRVGDLMRRPVLELAFAHMVEKEVKAESDTETRIKDSALRRLKASAWSQFVANERNRPGLRDKILKEHPGEDIWVDDKQWVREFMGLVKENPIFAYGMIKMTAKLADDYDETNTPKASSDYMAHGLGGRVHFYCDPEHAFNVGVSVRFTGEAVKKALGVGEKLPALVKEASLMLVEDNAAHRLWAETLDDVKGLSRYAPQEGILADHPLTRENEGRGCYDSAERALEVIEGNIGCGGHKPDIVLSDIELLGEMKGTQLVREIHRRYPNAIILMLYTSNPERFRDDIQGLVEEGVISGSWNKKDFTPHKFVEAVNKQLQQRGGE